ncbi:MAG: hypothetical protein QNK36_05200 [Colwellia sp.]|nr:hypothetical protein [Colwellia sp.]
MKKPLKITLEARNGLFTHKKTITEKVAKILALLLVTCSFSSQAISLTSYRMYLDNNNRTESFIMFTGKNNPEQCTVKLRHFNFDENGVMTPHNEESLPSNSAKPWVRFSPKNFKLHKGKPQTIRFSMRRKANIEPQEYRSYLAISCDEITPSTSAPQKTVKGRPSISVKPILVQNVPLVIRTGELHASGSFEEVKVVGDMLTAKLTRTGERSIYGRLALIDKKTNEELSFTSGISLYTETTSHAVSFPLNTKNMPPLEQLLLRFTEDEHYGGSLIIEKSIK